AGSSKDDQGAEARPEPASQTRQEPVMSRIGKKTIAVPAGVKIALKDRTINVEGPKGKLSLTWREEVAVKWTESEKAINVALAEGFDAENKEANAYWGSTRAHIRNM